MTSRSEQPKHCDHECVCPDYNIERINQGRPCAMKTLSGNFQCNHDTRSRQHPAPAPCPQHQIWQHCPVAGEIARKAREDLLNRLDKEIATRENEMNRKGNLEDNLTTATGYLTAAGALNWVRVVLIDGSRDTIDGDALRSTTPQSGQEQPR